MTDEPTVEPEGEEEPVEEEAEVVDLLSAAGYPTAEEVMEREG